MPGSEGAAGERQRGEGALNEQSAAGFARPHVH
jgi:hypothetical protein